MEAAEAWATQGEKDAFESFGLAADDLDFEIDVFPENWPALCCFMDLQTQWRSGMGGREGLIYAEVRGWMDERGLTRKKKRQDLMWRVQVLEMAALNAWAEASQQT